MNIQEESTYKKKNSITNGLEIKRIKIGVKQEIIKKWITMTFDICHLQMVVQLYSGGGALAVSIESQIEPGCLLELHAILHPLFLSLSLSRSARAPCHLLSL